MSTQNIALFKAMAAKMDYLDHRQRVVAQNVANADTPGYQARDLTEVDFGRVLQKATGSKAIRPETTDRLHLPAHNEVEDAKNREQRYSYEVAPAGNGVILEEQMTKASRTTMDYNLMTSLYQKHVAMMRTALGSGR